MPDRDERHRARIEAQRRRRRGKRRGANGRGPSRRALLIGGLLFVVVAGGGSAVVLSTRRDESPAPEPTLPPRSGSDVVEGAPAVEIVRTPATYRVVYRSESGSGESQVVTTDKIWVNRPFQSRLESFTDAPPGTKRLSEEVADFGLRRSAGDTEAPLVLAVTPQVGAADIRVAPALADAVEAKLVERREVRRVAGRLCQVYRSGTFFSDSVFKAATDEERADSCVDDAGIVLEEVLFAGDRQILRKVAVEVEEGAVVGRDLFVTGDPTVTVKDGGGFLRQADPTSGPVGEYFDVSPIPEGFTRRGRYTVIPPQPENFTDPTRESQQLAGTVDVFERGTDFVLVDQGATLRGAEPFRVDPASRMVDAGPVLGPAEVLLGPRGSEVRVARGGGRYMRVYGTLPVSELAAVARTLQPVQGAGLVYLP